MTKKAVLYARVSKDDRRNATSSLEAQLNLTREYAVSRGWQIVAELAEDDRGVRGSSFDLPKLNKALEMGRAGEFNVLVTRELDRFARGLAKQLIIEREFKQAGVQIEYVLGDYPDTPEGNLNKLIRAVIAEFEAEKIKERMQRGRRNKVKRGNVMTHGPAPYGYDRVETEDGTVTLVINEETSQIVKMIFNWYVNSVSVNDIVRNLTSMNVPTPSDRMKMRGVTKKKRFGEWNKATVWSILKNETYAGRWHYGKKSGNKKTNPRDYWIEVQVPAIIDEEMWLATVERRTTNKTMSKRNVKHDYLLRGMVICGHCGYKMQGHSYKYTSSIRTTRYFYYRCTVRAYPLDYSHVSCKLPNFKSDDVDAAVWGKVKSFLKSPKKLAEGIEYYKNEKGKVNSPIIERLHIVEELIEDNQTHLNRLLDLYLSDDFPKDMLVERKERLESTLQSLETERISLISKLENIISDSDVEELQDFASQIAKGIEKADKDFEMRRSIVEKLALEVKFAYEKGDKVIDIFSELGLEATVVLNNKAKFAHQAAADHQGCAK